MSPSCAGGCCSTPELPATIVTHLVIGEDRDAPAVAADLGRGFTGIDAEGMDQVKLAALWALLAGRPPDDALVLEFAPLHEVSEDGPWVFRVPAALVQLLSELADPRAAAVATAWADCDALAVDGWESDSVAPLLDGLRSLARGAREQRKSLLMRVSL